MFKNLDTFLILLIYFVRSVFFELVWLVCRSKKANMFRKGFDQGKNKLLFPLSIFVFFYVIGFWSPSATKQKQSKETIANKNAAAANQITRIEV